MEPGPATVRPKCEGRGFGSWVPNGAKDGRCRGNWAELGRWECGGFVWGVVRPTVGGPVGGSMGGFDFFSFFSLGFGWLCEGGRICAGRVSRVGRVWSLGKARRWAGES